MNFPTKKLRKAALEQFHLEYFKELFGEEIEAKQIGTKLLPENEWLDKNPTYLFTGIGKNSDGKFITIKRKAYMHYDRANVIHWIEPLTPVEIVAIDDDFDIPFNRELKA